jgi:hypothetical protein
MGYYCGNCKRWINDFEYHFCTNNTATADIHWNWTYPYVITNSCCDHRPECEKEDCLYYPDTILSGKRRLCQNKSVIIDKEGKCISYVKREEK